MLTKKAILFQTLQIIQTITMKTITCTTITTSFIMLCILSPAPTSARLLRKMQVKKNSSAPSTIGYNQARDLWNNSRRRYACSSLNDVLDGFWPDVKNTVFPKCESTYKLWSTSISDCKTGAERFATEKAGECMALSDCRDLGDIAAGGVAGVFCSAPRMGRGRGFFPPTCVSTAKSRCKDIVVDNVQGLADARQCGNVRNVLKDLGQSDIRKLDQACENEVSQMAKSAKLP
jgi:hypothetical protein